MEIINKNIEEKYLVLKQSLVGPSARFHPVRSFIEDFNLLLSFCDEVPD